MSPEQIRKLTKKVTNYLMRVTLFGRRTVTIWYGNIVDTIYITDENEEALKELMDYVDNHRRKNNGWLWR